MVEADFVLIALWAALVITGYHSLDYLFPLILERFRVLKPGRRRYVIKNVLKSALLFALSIACTPTIYRLFYHSHSDNEFIHTIGVLYAIPDVYALWWVRGMLYQSTVFHHISVALLATLGLFLDHSIDTHWIAMLVYAYLSMWTGVVNFYLGVRFLLKRDDPREDWARRNLASFALWVYVSCCAANWLYQLHTVMKWLDWRWGELSWGNFVGLLAYGAMLSFIIKDDLILIRMLTRECDAYSPPATLKEQSQHFVASLQAEIVDDAGHWPLIPGYSGGSLKGGVGQATVTTTYPWPVNVSSITQKAQRFRTPYDVLLQLVNGEKMVWTLTAVEDTNAAQSKE